ncbi:MAG: HAD family hydrolase [Bacteroidales bacterium]|jgi:putative hydrolase of the HAD superfamily|nr:HAD family hydrolase [Bacteroidales bacterium]
MTTKVIAFDADDTLWVNEPYFQETEKIFCKLMDNYLPPAETSRELLKTELKNISLYGFGVKSFVLSMIETAARVSDGQANMELAGKIIEMGQVLLRKPVELLDGVKEVLQELNGTYYLVLATKGDLLDQERKLQKSGLDKYFHHIEIMSDKKEEDYRKLFKRLNCRPEHFLMVGNSYKSDILPVLELGGYAIYIPYHTTWAHEQADEEIESPNCCKINCFSELITLLKK